MPTSLKRFKKIVFFFVFFYMHVCVCKWSKRKKHKLCPCSLKEMQVNISKTLKKIYVTV